MEKSFSGLSCHSKVNSKFQEFQGGKLLTTNHESKLDRESTIGTDSHDSPVSQLACDRLKDVQKKITLLERCQDELESKFEKVF